MARDLRLRGRLRDWLSRRRRSASSSGAEAKPAEQEQQEQPREQPLDPAPAEELVAPVVEAAAPLEPSSSVDVEASSLVGLTAAAPPYQAPVRPMQQGDRLPVATSGYGRRHPDPKLYPYRWGIDCSLPVNWRVRAVGDAVVIRVSDSPADPFNGTGIWYKLLSGPWAGQVAVAIHLNQRNVATGDMLVAGQVIGLSGNTGQSTGPHLHYEQQDYEAMNPGDPMDPTMIDWRGAGWVWDGWDE